jgi:hypothetical protein
MFATRAHLHLIELDNAEQICRQYLWHNTFIQIDGKTVCYTNWHHQNICFIQDLVNKKGKIMSMDENKIKYDL